MMQEQQIETWDRRAVYRTDEWRDEYQKFKKDVPRQKHKAQSSC